MDPAALAKMLNTYGAWGMVIILCIACWKLWSYSHKALEKRHGEFTDVLRETTKALSATAKAQEEASKTLDKAVEVLEASQKSNASVAEATRICRSTQQGRAGD